MKRLISLCFLCLLLVGCNQTSSEQEIYDKYYQVLKDTEEFKDNKQLPFDLKINSNQDSFKEYHYEFIITNPKLSFDNLKIAIMPVDFKSNEIIPTFNILEEVDISSFNDNSTGIKLNYFSQNKYESFKLLIEYNNKQEIFMVN